MFRRSGRPKKPGEGNAEEGAEKPECDGETCAILQAVKRLAAALSREEVAPNKSDDPENGPIMSISPFKNCFSAEVQ